ncbi:MAG: serine/threonine-protein kinase [Polyangiaceae bacterium]
MPPTSPPIAIGRYLFYDEVARGGMASVHYGRLTGPAGFSRTVAIKKLHADFASDPEFVTMFLDEARLAARIRHPNVVSVLDVVSEGDQILLVMDYVQGESLARLQRRVNERGEKIPLPIASAVMSCVLHGLHAAHETKDEGQRPLDIVHRDVSPQNVLLGADGVARVVDFGVAKAAVRAHTTRDNQIKGKLSYMAPEQLRAGEVDRRADVYSAGVVLWEMLTGQRLFTGASQAAVFGAVLEMRPPPPSQLAPDVPPELDRLVLSALAKNPAHRPATARELAEALEHAVRPATQREVGDWVQSIAADVLDHRAGRVAEIESHSRSLGASAAAHTPEPMPSQVSSISVSSSPSRRSGSRLRTWMVVGLVALAAGVVFLALRRGAADAPLSPVVATAVERADPARGASPPSAAPSPPLTSTPSATAPSSASPAPSASTAPVGRVAAARPSAPAPAAKPSKKLPSNCFTLDADGVMHPKPECLK